MSSPQASSISPVRLWFGILAAPFAWSAQELVCYGFVSRLCGRTAGIQITATMLPFMLVTLFTLAIALAGTWIAIDNWRRLENRQAGPECFLAKIGVITSAGFIVAFVFTTATLVVAPLC